MREPSPETPYKNASDLRLSQLIMPEFRNMTDQKYSTNIPKKKRNNAAPFYDSKESKSSQKDLKLARDL